MDDLVAGRYRLRREIARGAMAEVHEAEDTELGRTVALKFLQGEADPLRFEREARTFAALDHPGIVRVFDVGESARGRFIVLELVDGGTLEDLLAPGAPLDDRETRRIATEIAAALAHAHQRGVVHRDLKPANVLLDEEGAVKLTDFGIAAARELPTLTESGTVLGTASYMAPEQAAGDPTTAATDVYAFGVVLFRMLTGRLPFEGPNAVAVARLQLDEAPPRVTELRPDADESLAALAATALAKDPAARPPDGAALLAALGAPPLDPLVAIDEATAPLAPVAVSRRRRPERVALAVAVVAVLVLATGFGIAWLLTDDPAPAQQAPSKSDDGRATTARETTAEATTEPDSTATTRTESTTTTQTTTTQTTPAATAPAPATSAPPTPTTAQPTTTAGTTQPSTTEATTTGTTTSAPTSTSTTVPETVTTSASTTEPASTTPEGGG